MHPSPLQGTPDFLQRGRGCKSRGEDALLLHWGWEGGQRARPGLLRLHLTTGRLSSVPRQSPPAPRPPPDAHLWCLWGARCAWGAGGRAGGAPGGGGWRRIARRQRSSARLLLLLPLRRLLDWPSASRRSPPPPSSSASASSAKAYQSPGWSEQLSPTRTGWRKGTAAPAGPAGESKGKGGEGGKEGGGEEKEGRKVRKGKRKEGR